jgi:two-component system, NarL family, invasion response regulator UvrY
LKTLIADDHAVVRKGLARILAEAFSNVVCGEAQDAQEALDMMARERWDLVVLDVSMPGRNGLELLKQLPPGHKPPILVLSVHPESFYAVRALKSGAAGYLNKQSAPEELVRAVRKVLAGGKYVTPTVAEKLACDLDTGSARRPHETLSDREYEVMCLLASGKTLKEAASGLSLSPKTVSTYRARILEKMQLRTNAQLTWYALQNHLVAGLEA